MDILQLDVYHVGGISELKRIASICEKVDAGTANFAIQEMSPGIHYNVGSQDITSYLNNPGICDVEDGYIDLLTGPGLGIEIDEGQVRHLSVDTVPWVSPEFISPGGEVREWQILGDAIV